MTAQVLVLTDEAAAAVQVAPTSFTSWARRRGVRPVRHERRGRRTVAVWDLDAVYEATTRRPVYDTPREDTDDLERNRRRRLPD